MPTQSRFKGVRLAGTPCTPTPAIVLDFTKAEHVKVHLPGPRVDLPGQLELPDTDPKPAELAKRLAAAPMRPSVAQKPCDQGLFDDTQTQIDLEDMLG